MLLDSLQPTVVWYYPSRVNYGVYYTITCKELLVCSHLLQPSDCLPAPAPDIVIHNLIHSVLLGWRQWRRADHGGTAA